MNLFIYSIFSLFTISLAQNVTIIDDLHDLEASDSFHMPNRKLPTTYYDWMPGTYSQEAYGGTPIGYDRPYDPKSIYYRYLASPAYAKYNKDCKSSYTGKLILTQDVLQKAIGYGIAEMNKLKKMEDKIYRSGTYIKAPYTSAFARIQSSSYINRRSPRYKREKEAHFMSAVSKYLTKYYCLNPMQTNFMLPNLRIPDVIKSGYVDSKCRYSYGLPVPKHESCAHYGNLMYRSIDGTCNNLKFKYWGRSEVCQINLLPKHYGNALDSPKEIGTSGYPLPNPRDVANAIHHPWNARSYYTNMKMQFGQYMNHDMTHTPNSIAGYNGMLDCCKNPYHPECFPIMLSKTDYKGYHGSCFNFVRSAPCPLCVAGPRQQMNSITSYLDGSTTYGSTNEQSHMLRTHKRGMLKFSRDKHGHMILPKTNIPYNDQCTGGVKCFTGGDYRINQHPSLTALHVIWHNQHNRLSIKMSNLYPTWSDERVYQVVRAICIAQLQHITYNEYIPTIMSKEMMNYYGLSDNYGCSYYNPYADATIWSEYSTASCRYGHSQIPNWYSMVDGYGRNSKYGRGMKGPSGYYLRNSFFNQRYVTMGKTDALIAGLISDKSMTTDPWIENDVRNYLFRDGKNPGLDLAAANINRGRDHGLAGYIDYVEYCFNLKMKSWKQLELLMPPDEVKKLRKVYKYMEDIDLYTGIMSEKKGIDSDIGITASCLNGIQWYATKHGDRFFYSHCNLPNSLTKRQLADVRRTTLGSVICKNTYSMKKLQRYVLHPPSKSNPFVSCRSVPDVDLKAWANYGRYK